MVAIPSRSTMLHVNVVDPLNKTHGIGVTVDQAQSKPAQGYFVLNISVAHPFPGMPKFTGFDVRGIVITTAQSQAEGHPLPGSSDPELLNPDGYTRWWNPGEFPTPGLFGYTPGSFGKNPPPGNPLASTISPYKQFADGLYLTHDIDFITKIPPESPYFRGTFASGKTNSRQYIVQFPMSSGLPQIFFSYAVDASWVPPPSDNPDIPDDFPLEANCPEAFILKAEVDSDTLYNLEGTPLGGGELGLNITLWDWQGWLQSYTGQIGTVELLSPMASFESGITPQIDVNSDGSATLTAIIPGIPTEIGQIPVWVGVTSPGSNYYQGTKPAPHEPVAAYTKIMVEVAPQQCQSNENNDCSSAEDIAPIDSKEGALCLDVDPEDWFEFIIPTGGLATGTIKLTTFDVSDLDLYLLENCPSSPIEGSASPGNVDEQIYLSGLEGGEYYFKVICANDGNSLPRPYKLTTTIYGLGENCTIDSNNASGEAATIGLNDSASETVCPVGDPTDWYTFEIGAGASVFGTIDLANNSYADNNLYLYDSSLGTPLFSGESSGTGDEHFQIDLLDSGTYFLKVEAMGSDPTGDRPYDLFLDLSEIQTQCDDSDGNNTYDQATPIGLIDEATGTVCSPSDPDWYVFEVPSGGAQGDITLGNLDMADNDLAVFEMPPGDPLYESATSGTGDEGITVDLDGPAQYLIEVTASDTVQNVNQQYILSTVLNSQGENPTDFYVHVFIIRSTQGTNPAIPDEVAEGDVAWADQFYGTWADGAVILSEISYIDNTKWLSLTTGESIQMFNQYGDQNGALSVFYVNDTPDMYGAAAYTWMECEFELESFESCFVVINDYADSASLAHEMGHAIGLLGDMYLLDYYNCNEITYCDTGPSDVFCLESDGEYGNLMYWPVGENVNDYWMSDYDKQMDTPHIDSQIENIVHFNTYYPDAFMKP
jgi:hypothetical protein